MSHFSYPLTIVQINIFVEPQNIFPNQNPRPQTIEPAPVFLTIECPPPPWACATLWFFTNVSQTASFNKSELVYSSKLEIKDVINRAMELNEMCEAEKVADIRFNEQDTFPRYGSTQL